MFNNWVDGVGNIDVISWYLDISCEKHIFINLCIAYNKFY